MRRDDKVVLHPAALAIKDHVNARIDGVVGDLLIGFDVRLPLLGIVSAIAVEPGRKPIQPAPYRRLAGVLELHPDVGPASQLPRRGPIFKHDVSSHRLRGKAPARQRLEPHGNLGKQLPVRGGDPMMGGFGGRSVLEHPQRGRSGTQNGGDGGEREAMSHSVVI